MKMVVVANILFKSLKTDWEGREIYLHQHDCILITIGDPTEDLIIVSFQQILVKYKEHMVVNIRDRGFI